MIEEADYIVVGAGSAGSIVASELSRDAKTTVLLLESGPPDKSFLINMPRGVSKLLDPAQPLNWSYQVATGGNRPNETWVKGRTLGGSSSINGMVYSRGHAADYDGWAAQGCAGWGWKDMLPYIMALEDHELGPAPERGVGGAFRLTSRPSTRNFLTEAYLDAQQQAGTPRVEDLNGAPDGGVGYPFRTIYRGQRQSAAKAFLHPARGRPNLHVMTDTDVLRIRFEGVRAVGVEIRGPQGVRVVRARRETIVCCGAIQTPKLLQLSGVGPAERLRPLGVEMVCDSPNVGRNLREHAIVDTKFRVTGGSMNQEFRGLRLLANALRYQLFKSGPMAQAAVDYDGFVKTRPGLSRPDCQMMGGLFSINRGPSGIEIEKLPGMSIAGYFMHPQSQGETYILSPDPDVPPYVNANYLAAEEDREATVAIMKMARKVAAQPALKRYIVRELSPGPDVVTDDEILAHVMETVKTAYHVSCTCRMGDDPGSVVDPQLRVRGVDRLRVVDTSVFPSMPSGNTNAPAMAFGLKAAAMIREGAASPA